MNYDLPVWESNGPQSRNQSPDGSRSYPDGQVDAHLKMAANIEQIFQEFILNKIREIEDQKDDKAYVNIFVLHAY